MTKPKPDTGRTKGVPARIKAPSKQVPESRRSHADALAHTLHKLLPDGLQHDPLDDLTDAARTAIVQFVETGDATIASTASGLAPTTVSDILRNPKYKTAIASAKNIRFQTLRFKALADIAEIAADRAQETRDRLVALQYILRMTGAHDALPSIIAKGESTHGAIALKHAARMVEHEHGVQGVDLTADDLSDLNHRPMISLNITLSSAEQPGDRAKVIDVGADVGDGNVSG